MLWRSFYWMRSDGQNGRAVGAAGQADIGRGPVAPPEILVSGRWKGTLEILVSGRWEGTLEILVSGRWKGTLEILVSGKWKGTSEAEAS